MSKKPLLISVNLFTARQKFLFFHAPSSVSPFPPNSGVLLNDSNCSSVGGPLEWGGWGAMELLSPLAEL